MTAEGEPIPTACSLGAGSLAERIDEWRALVTSSFGQREKRCCAFFDVAIGLGADSRTLSLTVPDRAEEALAAFVVLLTS